MKYPTIYLIRHGQTEWNVEGRYQGQKDSPLTQKGKEQARLNALKLQKEIKNFDEVKIYSSPLGRAKNSAFIICDELNIERDKIIFDKRIEEFDYGIFEGELKSLCQTQYAEMFQAREADKWWYQIEGGDSYEIVTNRLKLWLDEVKNEKVIVMVAHEMINRALRGLYLNLEHNKTLKLRQPNDLVLLLEGNEEKSVT
ncbi:MAG: histidine phosphatase family protein [Sulfurovaceae bacterium]|nr:histidine phosphatase family protein [Sulfurovaceae bacterium]